MAVNIPSIGPETVLDPARLARFIDDLLAALETINSGDDGGLSAAFITVANDTNLPNERRLLVNTLVFSLTDAGAGSTITLDLVDGAVSNAKIRDSAGLSVVGRAANTSGDVGDITAAADGDVLYRNGASLAFGKPLASTTVAALVKQAGAVTDANASSVSVASPDAATQTASYVQADVQSIADLANELKSDVNQLVTDLNAVKDQLNALLASERTAGQLET